MRKTISLIFCFVTLLILISTFITPSLSLAQTQLPDLIVLSVRQSGNQIYYTIANNGASIIGKTIVSYYNALFVDGNPVAMDHVNYPLAAGQQIERAFNYQYQATPPSDTIRIIADYQQNIAESNESNNILETVWKSAVSLPDLIVEKIECGAGNKLSITIKNVGPGPLPPGWSASGQVRFNGQVKGTFDLRSPTTVHYGGIAVSGGSSVYLLQWDIVAPTTVECAVDITGNIDESNEQNNYKADDVAPAPSGCSAGCVCMTLDEAKTSGYSLYCNGVQTICGYSGDGTPKYCWTMAEPPPDLLVQGIRLNIITTNQYEIEYTIVNWGRGDAPASRSALYVDDVLVAEDNVSALSSAEERDEVFAWRYNMASCTPPRDTIRIVADYQDLIDESYEDNNDDSLTVECTAISPPDLHIRRVWTEPLGTGEHSIGYEIENTGTGPAPSSRTGLYVDDVLMSQDTVGPLEPLGRTERVFTYLYDNLSCTGESDIIRLSADFDHAITETNETNNDESLTWTCPTRANPDLIINNVWWESDPGSLQNLWLRYSIENRSVSPAGPSLTTIWINGESFCSSSVPALDSLEVLPMVTFPIRWTPEANDNHIRICADAGGVVHESPAGEENNCLETDWAFESSCCDRLQSGDEEGIDCGGTKCPPCNRCDMTTLPARFDWRDYTTLPLIRDQEHCGSCWAHAACGAMEANYAINHCQIINLSEQYCICYVPGNCGGGCPHDVFRHARSTGIIDELCEPYLASNSPCQKCSDWEFRLWTIVDYKRVSSDIQAIKKALICYGPLSVGSESWEHAVVIVGYDDSRNSWIIRNSWGTGWGDHGYGEVPYSGVPHSDLRNYVHYVIGVMAP